MKKNYIKPYVEMVEFVTKENIMDIDLGEGEDGDIGFQESVPDEF